MNRWNIPQWLEDEVRNRDKNCVYCGKKMIYKVIPGLTRKDLATWEHIINDENIITRSNIALCCSSCNSSKGTKNLSDWINSKYCRDHGINAETVSDIVKNALGKQPPEISSENSGIIR